MKICGVDLGSGPSCGASDWQQEVLRSPMPLLAARELLRARSSARSQVLSHPQSTTVCEHVALRDRDGWGPWSHLCRGVGHDCWIRAWSWLDLSAVTPSWRR